MFLNQTISSGSDIVFAVQHFAKHYFEGIKHFISGLWIKNEGNNTACSRRNHIDRI